MSTPAINPAEARVQSLSNPCYQAANISDNNFEDCIKCTIWHGILPRDAGQSRLLRDLNKPVPTANATD